MKAIRKTVLALSLVTLLLSFLMGINPVKADEQSNISVSAMVPPTTSNYQFSFATDAQGTVRQDTIIPYTITYGASSSAAVTAQTTITADWSGDKAVDGTLLTDYVPDSASNAYGDAPPIVDLVKHTITWTITLPPGVMDQKVTFSVKTNSNYTQPKTSYLTTVASMSNQYVTMPNQVITVPYQYQVSPTQPLPTSTPAPQQPTITPASSLEITNVSLSQILTDSAIVQAMTNNPATLSVAYGTSPQALVKTLKTASFAQNHTATLTQLLPDTPYYFQITAMDSQGNKTVSDIFTFKTANTVNTNSLTSSLYTIISNNTVVFSNTITPSATTLPVIVLPPNTQYQLMVTLPAAGWLQSGEIEVISNQSGSTLTVPLIGLSPTVFSATLQTGGQIGNAEIVGRTLDTDGNLKLQPLAQLHVVPQFQVTTPDDKPVADARVMLYVRNQDTGQFIPLTAVFPNLELPMYTNLEGMLSLVLPKGTYKAEVSSLGFSQQTVQFAIDDTHMQAYPHIVLSQNPLDSKSVVLYFVSALGDFFATLHKTLKTMAQTMRYFNLIAVSTVSTSVLLSYLLLQIRTHFRISHMAVFLLFHFNRFTRMDAKPGLFGAVVDEKGIPLSRVRIEISDPANEMLLAHTATNKAGKFYLTLRLQKTVRLTLRKEGYPPLIQAINKDMDIPEGGPIYVLTHNTDKPSSIIAEHAVQEVFGMLFEVVLIISIVFELLFLSVFGVAKTLPFISLSLLNMAVWLLFLREGKNKVGA